jgi:hypothetical protein
MKKNIKTAFHERVMGTFCCTLICLLLSSCYNEEITTDVTSQQKVTSNGLPVINNISPLQIITNDTVTVQGINFGKSIPLVEVIFTDSTTKVNTSSSIIYSVDSATIKVKAPQITGTGYITVKVNGKAALSNQYFTQSQWKKIGYCPLGMPQRSFASTFAIGDVIFFCCGESVPPQTGLLSVYYHDLWAYDTNSGQWSRLADFPGTERSHAVSFVINGKAYVGTGCKFTYTQSTGSVYSLIAVKTLFKDFYEYTPSGNSWKKIADINIPDAGRIDMSSFVSNGDGYVGLGLVESLSSGVAQKDFYKYTVASNSWVKLTPSFPVAVWGAFSFVINNQAYVGGGIEPTLSNTVLPSFKLYAFNPAGTTTATMRTLKSTISTGIANPSTRIRSTGFVKDGKCYLSQSNAYIKSNGNGQFINATQAGIPYLYDPTGDSWSALPTIPASMTNCGMIPSNGLSTDVAGSGGGGVGVATATKAFYYGRYHTLWEFMP